MYSSCADQDINETPQFNVLDAGSQAGYVVYDWCNVRYDTSFGEYTPRMIRSFYLVRAAHGFEVAVLGILP